MAWPRPSCSRPASQGAPGPGGIGAPRAHSWHDRRSLARHLSIDGRTRWLGWLPHDEVLGHYASADVFVFTSLRDTSGNVVLEALAAGVPIICLDHQGVRDIVAERCGVKVPVTTPEASIDAITAALAGLARNRERCIGSEKVLWSARLS